MMSKFQVTTSTLLAAVLATASTAGAQTLLGDSAAGYDTDISGTGIITFDFDYSSFTHELFTSSVGDIPSAPNTPGGTATTGIFMSANQSGLNAGQAISSIFPKALDVGAGTATPNFVFTFDAWNNTGLQDPLSGTTNYQLGGVNYEAGPVQWGDFNSTTTAAQGLQMGVVGDHGAAEDFFTAYGGKLYGDRPKPTNTSPNEVWGDGGSLAANVTGLVQMDILEANGLDGNNFSGSAGHPYYEDQFPALVAGGPGEVAEIRAGVPSNRWATHEVSVVNGTFSYLIDGRVFAQLDLADVPDASDTGTLMLGFWDRFSSVAASPPGGNFVIYDNISLDVLNTVPVADISAYIPLIGDLDGDGFVGITDLNLILGAWNTTVLAGDPADPSGDLFIGIEDLNVVLGNWNAGVLPPPGSVVPEPASLALLGLGGIAMLRRRR